MTCVQLFFFKNDCPLLLMLMPTVLKIRMFSVVNALVFRGHCDILRNLLTLSFVINFGRFCHFSFVIFSTPSGVNWGQFWYFGTLPGVKCGQLWYSSTLSGVNYGKFRNFEPICRRLLRTGFVGKNYIACPVFEPITSHITSHYSINCATNSQWSLHIKRDTTRNTGDVRQATCERKCKTIDIRQETWDRRGEIWDVRQQTWDRRCETGDRWRGTGKVRQETWERRCETGDMR